MRLRVEVQEWKPAKDDHPLIPSGEWVPVQVLVQDVPTCTGSLRYRVACEVTPDKID